MARLREYVVYVKRFSLPPLIDIYVTPKTFSIIG
jgi:hypothetical protein